MEKIICDAFNTNGTADSRFTGGLKMQIIIGADSQLTRRSYEVSTLTCCSSVRQTSLDWFYLLPAIIDRDLLEKWLKEITPIFSNLNIQITSIKDKKLSYKNEGLSSVLSLCQHENNVLITLPIDLSKRSNGQYGISCENRYKSGELSNVDFLIEKFCNYCIDHKIKIFDDHNSIINNFIKEEYNNLLSLELDNTIATVHLPSGAYAVQLGIIVDFESIDKSLIMKYISRLFIANKHNIISYICKKIETAKQSDDVELLQVLYSKKTSNIQAYLAHHLIRAGFSADFSPFINQYFIIKEQLPDIGFWNRILYTQFGFKFYYYYWLTDQRTFRNVSDEEMANLIKNSSRNSSKDFLANFQSDMSIAIKNRARILYSAGDFIRFHQLMTGGVLVQLLPESVKKFTNLRLSSDYTVTSDDDKYYFIQGDDYKLRRYSKKHFKILER